MSKEIKNLLKTALDKDGSSFKDKLENILSQRIESQLGVRKDEISPDIVKQESVELDEGTYTFKNSSEAGKFIKAASQAGIDKKVLKAKGNSDEAVNDILRRLQPDLDDWVRAGVTKYR